MNKLFQFFLLSLFILLAFWSSQLAQFSLKENGPLFLILFFICYFSSRILIEIIKFLFAFLTYLFRELFSYLYYLVLRFLLNNQRSSEEQERDLIFLKTFADLCGILLAAYMVIYLKLFEALYFFYYAWDSYLSGH